MRSPFVPFVLAVCAFWVLVFALGFPSPSVDDVFYTGAATGLVRSGELKNPYLREYLTLYSGTYFFQYPPFHSYALAGFLTLFGIHERSMLAFQSVWYVAASVALGALIRATGYPRHLMYVSVLLFALFILGQGLRPDAMAFGLLFPGLWLLTRTGRGTLAGGLTLMAASVLTWPTGLFIVAGVGGGLILRRLLLAARVDAVKAEIVSLASAGAVTIVIVGGLFLIAIGGRVLEFRDTFTRHTGLVLTGSVRAELASVVERFLIGFEWLLTLPVLSASALVMVAALAGWRRFSREFLVTLGGFLVSCGLFLLIKSAWAALVYHAWWGAGFLLPHAAGWPERRRRAVAAVLGVLLLVHHTRYVLSWIASDRLDRRQAVEMGRQAVTTGRPVVLDAVAARYAFDYRLPPGSVDYSVLIPASQPYPSTIRQKSPGDVWLATAHDLPADTPGLTEERRGIVLFGREFRSIPQHPWRLMLIP